MKNSKRLKEWAGGDKKNWMRRLKSVGNKTSAQEWEANCSSFAIKKKKKKMCWLIVFLFLFPSSSSLLFHTVLPGGRGAPLLMRLPSVRCCDVFVLLPARLSPCPTLSQRILPFEKSSCKKVKRKARATTPIPCEKVVLRVILQMKNGAVNPVKTEVCGATKWVEIIIITAWLSKMMHFTHISPEVKSFWPRLRWKKSCLFTEKQVGN